MFYLQVFVFCSILCISLGIISATSSDIENYHIKDFSCDRSGYEEYLNNYDERIKQSAMILSFEEYEKRLQYFIENCNKIHEWNTSNMYKLEFTYY